MCSGRGWRWLGYKVVGVSGLCGWWCPCYTRPSRPPSILLHVIRSLRIQQVSQLREPSQGQSGRTLWGHLQDMISVYTQNLLNFNTTKRFIRSVLLSAVPLQSPPLDCRAYLNFTAISLLNPLTITSSFSLTLTPSQSNRIIINSLLKFILNYYDF